MRFYDAPRWDPRIDTEMGTPMLPTRIDPAVAMLFEDDPTPRHVETIDVEDADLSANVAIEQIGESEAVRFGIAIESARAMTVTRGDEP